MEPVSPELFHMQLCIIWHTSNIVDGCFSISLVLVVVLYWTLLLDPFLVELLSSSLILLIWFEPNLHIRHDQFFFISTIFNFESSFSFSEQRNLVYSSVIYILCNLGCRTLAIKCQVSISDRTSL